MTRRRTLEDLTHKGVVKCLSIVCKTELNFCRYISFEPSRKISAMRVSKLVSRLRLNTEQWFS